MINDETSGASPPSLAEEQAQLTRSRIRKAAMRAVARHGFNATVEEIAEESGVSPRTIFRHYQTQSALIAATLEDMFEEGVRPIAGLPSPTDDLDGWLEGLAHAAHTRNVEIYGEAIWDLRGSTSKLPAVLSEIIDSRLRYRRRALKRFAVIAWRAAGGQGEPPDVLTSAFTVQLSPFTAEVLMVDRDKTPSQVGAVVADILKALIRCAVEDQRVAHPVDNRAEAGEQDELSRRRSQAR